MTYVRLQCHTEYDSEVLHRQWLQNCPWIFKFETLFQYLTTSCNVIVTHDDKNAVGLVETW